MSSIWERKNEAFEKIKSRKREIAVIALIFIILASMVYYQVNIRYRRKNVIGILRIEGYIVEPEVVNRYINLINEAILNQRIKGVVLVVDSGGGYADYVEEIYSDLLELKKSKPLVASVTRALSGGYYITVACDYIFVQNSSLVGSIGAIGFMPPTLIPSEMTVESGPYKWTGESKILRFFTLSRIVDNFVSAVENGRGDRLKASSTELKKAMIYLGSEAIKLGLADASGGLQNAISKIVDELKLVEYTVEELKIPEESASSSVNFGSGNVSPSWNNITVETLSKLHPPPSIYYIYLPPQAITQSDVSTQFDENVSSISSRGEILIDLSHGNRVSWWTFNILISELAKRNMTVSFISNRETLKSKLDAASCLIIASPTEIYSAEEIERIVGFVKEGKLLILFFDPAWEYIGTMGLSQGIIAPINSLSTRFGISFAKGYLYNEAEHFGIYRNIYVKNFANSPLTKNLNSLVFFTATNIYSMGKEVAWTSNDTYSSVAERADNYATIIWMKRGNGTVAAFGDLTFLQEPYCYVEDNYQLILNLVSLIDEVTVSLEEKVDEDVKEEVAKPDLPVGTEKNFTEWIDGGEGYLVKWFKVSETEIRVERPNRTIHYYLTEDDALWRSVSDGMECIYEDPLPEPPFPLTRGEKWRYESNYTLIVEGMEYKGNLVGEEEVEGFEDVLAGDNNRYFCARVRYTSVDHLIVDGGNMTIISKGYYWISSDVGTVKQELTIDYYSNYLLMNREKRTLLLKSIKKG